MSFHEAIASPSSAIDLNPAASSLATVSGVRPNLSHAERMFLTRSAGDSMGGANSLRSSAVKVYADWNQSSRPEPTGWRRNRCRRSSASIGIRKMGWRAAAVGADDVDDADEEDDDEDALEAGDAVRGDGEGRGRILSFFAYVRLSANFALRSQLRLINLLCCQLPCCSLRLS